MKTCAWCGKDKPDVDRWAIMDHDLPNVELGRRDLCDLCVHRETEYGTPLRYVGNASFLDLLNQDNRR